MARGTDYTPLEEAGFQVIAAHDGKHALEIFQRHINEWKLVILDIVMPKTGGLSAAKRMSQMRPELPIVMMTGYNLNESPQKHEEVKWHVLSKPWNVNSLNTVLERALKTDGDNLCLFPPYT
ncbi:MAG: response regulator [Mariprofundaceae bacterium]|nr:response regulator [Mariprofundaceae bacterium]